jgi:hypothetical protein
MKVREKSKLKAAAALGWRQYSRKRRMVYHWGPRSPRQSQRLAKRIVELMPSAH